MNQPKLIFKPTKLQHKAWNYIINSPETVQLLIGGSVGWGKSYFGCYAAIMLSLTYEGIRSFIYRTTLTQLKVTTMNTFFEILDKHNFVKDVHYTFNKSENVLVFFNGSQVYFKQCPYVPSDPDYNYLGSSEATYIFFDEVAQGTQRAVDILMGRLRYKIQPEKGLYGKIVMSCNPTRNFLYNNYVVPYQKGELSEHVKLVLGTTLDNKENLPESYIRNLNFLNDIDKKRLLYGSWEYDNEINSLFDAYTLNAAFIKPDNRFITIGKSNANTAMINVTVGVDLAETTDDNTSITFMVDELVTNMTEGRFTIEQTGDIINQYLAMLKTQNKTISAVNIIYDAIGVGYSFDKVCKPRITTPVIHQNIKFHPFKGSETAMIDWNRAEAIGKTTFKNKRAQAFYVLSQKVKDAQIFFHFDINDSIKNKLITQLIAHKLYNTETTDAIQIIPKQQIKKVVGSSPDLADSLSMAVHFQHFKRNYTKVSTTDFAVF